MSTSDYQPTEGRSSIQITENSKGEPAISVKIYSHDLDLDATRAKAIEVYKATRDAVR